MRRMMAERLRERWEFCIWEREREWNGGGKKEIEKKKKLMRGENKKYYLLLAFKLPCIAMVL